MAKYCAKCGTKIGLLSDYPLELSENCILCSSCSSPISGRIAKLYHMSSKEDFELCAKEITDFSSSIYNNQIVDAIKHKVSEIYTKTAPNMALRPTVDHSIIDELVVNQLLTTGYNFHGYTIKKYFGIISGEVVLGTGFLSEFSASFSDFLGSKSESFAKKLESAKDAALKRLIQHSAEKGGNAVIGVDFDYITFSSNMIGVVANGTSVLIEKNQE